MLTPEQKATVGRIMKRYYEAMGRTLTESAVRAYAEAFMRADRSLGYATSPSAVSEAAMRYAKEYGDLLIREGATIINGEKIPWMAESAERTRSDVFRIIEDGLAAGKYPGVKEKAKGGYAPGTIAGDLQEYFGERKSHATTVARTETGRILNLGQLQRYKDRGIAYVKVLDDEGPHSCAACAAANGQVWTLDYAMEHELEHPNCVRAYVAVRD